MSRQVFEVAGPIKLPCLLVNGIVKNLKLYMYRFALERDYYVIENGVFTQSEIPLVRIHSACSFTVFNSQRCDCQAQLDEAMIRLSAEEPGLLIYAWHHEGRGVGMWDHVRVYKKQDEGKDTVTSYEALGLPVDSRDYSDTIEILKNYGITELKLLTNNPKKIASLREAGIKVTHVPLVKFNLHNAAQMKTKIEKLGHSFYGSGWLQRLKSLILIFRLVFQQ